MKKSLFMKQFVIYMLILLFSFIMLGVVFTYAFKAYYLKQKEQLLIQQAERISNQYALGIYTGVVDGQRISAELRILSDNMQASAIMVERTGRVMFVSGDVDIEWIGNFVNEDSLLKAVNEGVIVTENDSDGIFYDTALTTIYPVKIDKTVFAALIMNVSVPGVKDHIMSVYRIIFAVLALCCAVAFIALYLSVKRITKPLIEINEAAKIIAGGDFERRIETDLVDEVGQLSESFNEMAESLSKLEENKRTFISNISHDIRSPLTSILGFITAMLDGTAPPEDFPRYLSIVKDESERIIKLANEMIDVNILDNQVIGLKEFDINGLIRHCAENAEENIKSKGLNFELSFSEKHVYVNADYGKIERVLNNLLDNAIKFTEKGSIKIGTTVKDEKVFVSVTDTGIGICEKELKHVFERFYKSDNSRGKHRYGHGLGLSIVKEFIKAHNETVTVESVKGKGSSFVFTLPVANK